MPVQTRSRSDKNAAVLGSKEPRQVPAFLYGLNRHVAPLPAESRNKYFHQVCSRTELWSEVRNRCLPPSCVLSKSRKGTFSAELSCRPKAPTDIFTKQSFYKKWKTPYVTKRFLIRQIANTINITKPCQVQCATTCPHRSSSSP